MNVLLLAPHADDVELGCGATIARFIEEKQNVLWIVFVEDKILNDEHMKAVQELGLSKKSCLSLNFKLRHLPECRQDILDYLFLEKTRFKPDLIVGPSLNDFHQDHRTVAEEMVRAFKTSASIICYELPWNHISFDVQLLVKLEERHVKKKLQMLEKFESEIKARGSYFSEKSARGLGTVRGLQAGSEYAEAFEVMRWVL